MLGLPVARSVLVCLLVAPALVFGPARATTARADRSSRPVPAVPAPPGLQLSASPPLADVGDDVTFTLTARSWPAPAGVTLSFVSPHHGFTGQMVWTASCACFQVAVKLARRSHPIELARASATVRMGQSRVATYTTFNIRGLAPNGKDFAPGGTPFLSGWVSDPWPVGNEVQHFCAWVKTLDGLGVAGYRVQFIARYAHKKQQWTAGTTGKSGIVCSNRSIGQAQPGIPVQVDVYAGSLHVRTQFTPRS